MRIRLKARAFINNHRHEAGDIVELPDGSVGPQRCVTDASRFIGRSVFSAEEQQILVDCNVPLFEIVSE